MVHISRVAMQNFTSRENKQMWREESVIWKSVSTKSGENILNLRLFAATMSKYWVSINLWQLLQFNIAIFGIFLSCHAVTITRNRVTKIICIAIFWGYLPSVVASVSPVIHIILQWPLKVELPMSGAFWRGGNFCFASELVLRQLQPIWQSDYRNGDRCQIWPELESKEKIETVPIFLTIQTNSDCGFVVSFGLWITIFVKMAKTGETTIVAANSL